MKKILFISVLFSVNCLAQTSSQAMKDSSVAMMKRDLGVNVVSTALVWKTDSLATALATFTQTRLNDTSAAIRAFAFTRQSPITTGTTAQYLRGDLSLATFPTTTAAFTNSTNKNFVTDAQSTVIGNTAGSNSGDNANNTQYANDYRAGNFAAGTNYLAPNGSAAALTGFPTLNQNTTGTAAGLSANIAQSQVTSLVTDLGLKAPLASPAFTGTPTGIGIPVYARVTGSNATTTGQALVDVTGLTLSLVANGVYEIEAMLVGSTTAVTTGTGYGIQYSAAGATIEGFVQGSATTTADKTLRVNAFNTSVQAWLTTSAQTGGILIKATVTVGANAGTLSVRHLKVTSGTSTVFIGSSLKATRIL